MASSKAALGLPRCKPRHDHPCSPPDGGNLQAMSPTPAALHETARCEDGNMSDCTTFEFTMAQDKLDAFGEALAILVEDTGCGTAPASAGTTGPALTGLLREVAAGRLGAPCLTLGFAHDAPLLAFQAENPGLRSPHAGTVAVGCFWLRCVQGEDRFTVSLDSATASIASLMRASASVQDAIRAVGRATVTGAVQVIDEWNDVSVL